MSSSQTSSSSSDVASALPEAYRPFADVTCDVDIVLGTGEISIRTCMGLQQGSVVRLQQSAGQDLALTIDGVLIARGEVVIMDDGVSVRITELARPGGDGR
jgi:flagellar motor switch protein FliN/FliY